MTNTEQLKAHAQAQAQSGICGPGSTQRGPKRTLRERAVAQLGEAEFQLAGEAEIEAARTQNVILKRTEKLQAAMRLAQLIQLLDRNPSVAAILELQDEVRG